MKKSIFLCLALILFAGCARKQDKDILVRINNYQITFAEFDEEFKNSPYNRDDTLVSKVEFLDYLINRKLMLQDAERKNLDKDPEFLKMIEKFWEQSLLRLALDEKAREVEQNISISDNTIEKAYQKMLREGKTDKSYEDMYNQIKWDLMKFKESQRMDEWVNRLRAQAKVKVNYDLLK